MRYRLVTLATAVALFGCGSEESKMERGMATGQEKAVPSATDELDMSEAERQLENAAEEASEENKAFEEATEGR